MVKCQKNAAFPFLYVNGVTLVKIHCQLEVCGLCVYLVVWCSAFDNGRTDDDKRRVGLPSLSATVDAACRADIVREDRCIKLTDMTQERGILVSSVYSFVHNQQDY